MALLVVVYSFDPGTWSFGVSQIQIGRMIKMTENLHRGFSFFGPNLISWCTKKQPKVSRSSTEAEYRALALLPVETMWVTYSELRATHTVPALYCYNKSTICVAKNSVLHTRMKHVDTDCLFVRDEVQAGTMIVQYVPTEEQPTDIFTKPLPSRRHDYLSSKLPFASAQLA